jgi:membrane peptidoglycan carboxypeptidase
VELPGEEKGLARPVAQWTKSSIGSIAMGQELMATPLQMVAATSIIADEGVWHRPHIIREMVHQKSLPELGLRSVVQAAAPDPADSHRVITAETALKIRNMLEMVVMNGTGTKARLNGYSSAGKSGTAQIFDANIHHYSPTNYVASFVGFAPVRDPSVTIAVILDSPVGGHHGGEVSAPVFKRVAEQVLSYRQVRPDLPVNAKSVKPEKIDPAQLSDSLDEGQEPAGDATVKPAAAAIAETSEVSAVMDLGGSLVAPDFLGKSARAVAEAAAARGLIVDVSGSGVVREQSPSPGGRLLPGRRITVRLGR